MLQVRLLALDMGIEPFLTRLISDRVPSRGVVRTLHKDYEATIYTATS